jgi:hypothetical protein
LLQCFINTKTGKQHHDNSLPRFRYQQHDKERNQNDKLRDAAQPLYGFGKQTNVSRWRSL